LSKVRLDDSSIGFNADLAPAKVPKKDNSPAMFRVFGSAAVPQNFFPLPVNLALRPLPPPPPPGFAGVVVVDGDDEVGVPLPLGRHLHSKVITHV
jgi:hypothetical protein